VFLGCTNTLLLIGYNYSGPLMSFDLLLADT
jgi:hypothetical protein